MGREGTVEEVVLGGRKRQSGRVAGICGDYLDLGSVVWGLRECLDFEGGIEAQSQAQTVETRTQIGAAGRHLHSYRRYMGRHVRFTPLLEKGQGYRGVRSLDGCAGKARKDSAEGGSAGGEPADFSSFSEIVGEIE
jgi:hypothetical protein